MLLDTVVALKRCSRCQRVRRKVSVAGEGFRNCLLSLPATIFFMIALMGIADAENQDRPRARDLGIAPGVFATGALNSITDVRGVRVGHVTLIEGGRTRTGVTVVLPHSGNLFQSKVPGAVFVANGFGKLAGLSQVEELGVIETPIALTNTLAVGAVSQGLIEWTLRQPGNEDVRSVNPLVGETNDGLLNDIRRSSIKPSHVIEAIEVASDGLVVEGNVGAGTGTRAFAWKAGIGSSSRRLPESQGGYVVGVLVQSNFGGVLSVDGIPVGKLMKKGAYLAKSEDDAAQSGDGSCMIVVATDAPIDARELKRVAARALYGMARTGSSFSNGSGDYAIAFTTDPLSRVAAGDRTLQTRRLLPADSLSPLFQATIEATEEAIYNSLFRAESMSSDVGGIDSLPVSELRSLIERYQKAFR